MSPRYATYFDLDENVSYLNAAYMSPMPRSADASARAGLAEKMRPWTRNRAAGEETVEDVRALAGKLIGATADDIAIVNSVSYGIALACANLRVTAGSRLLFLEDEHHSAALSMRALARRSGAVADPVLRPADGDWTQAVLMHIDADERPISLAMLTPVHWMDGTIVDVERVARVLKARGAFVIVDATQAAGVTPIDIGRMQADFVVFPTYKWLLGPYGCALLYVAPQHQDGLPFEEHAFNHAGPIVPLAPRGPAPAYAPGARRFDRGEIEGYITMPMARAGLSYVTDIAPGVLSSHIADLTRFAAAGLRERGIATAAATLQSPHILSFRLDPLHVQAFPVAMEAAGVVVTCRYGLCRVSPHIYNSRGDIQKLLDTIDTL